METTSTTGTPAVTSMGVLEQAALIARGELTPADLIEQTIARIQAIEGRIHAWSQLDVEGARAQAAALTKEAAAGKLRGPLHGVPYGIKEEFHVKGMTTGMRSQDPLPLETEDATVVARLRDAGAVFMGKTYMPLHDQPVPTRNPWNQEHTAGGTSSGSGASVGAHTVPFAIGEQTMGSNLRPACYCGCTGLKPTWGRISRFGCAPFAWSCDHVGLIARGFPDMALVLSVLAGPDPRDRSALPIPPPPAGLEMASYRAPRIGVVRNFVLERTEPGMRQELESAVARMRDAGASVTDFQLPEEWPLVYQADRVVTAAEGATYHAPEHPHTDMSGSAGRSGALVPATYYLQARRIRNWLAEKVIAAMGPLDAIVMPTTPAPAPKPPGTGNASFLVPWSFLGFPAINVPCALVDGLPVGLQFISRPANDYELLRLGAWTENVLGRLPAPPL